MSWRHAGRRDLTALLEFLLPEEALFVPFTSRLRAGSRGFEIYMDADPTGAVRDCFLHTSGGLLLPAFSPAGQDGKELAALLNGLRPMVHSIMGVGRCVDVVEANLPLPPTTRVEYFLMTLAEGTRHPVLPPDPPGLRVRKAGPYDAESLFPIQKCYELEEVVITPAHFNEAQCMKSLRLALREQLVYVAELDGVPVSKAATNARGYKVDQIGGVYTVPQERGKGLGKAVVSELLKTVFSEKQAACLFVKKHNRSALALYERLGFSPVTDYVISYYGL
ncbi:MAG: GNAT family N-acetyltransferase [Spirochaetia bacterium]|jgi:predicted GNAT family acetyltransferase